MASGSEASREQRLGLILADYLRAEESGQNPDAQAIIKQHPDLADELHSFFANRAALERVAEPLRGAGGEATVAHSARVVSVSSGTTVRYLGDYELLQEIARGGMGVVFKARQASLNRIVAVKMILAGALADESAVKRFRQEAEAAANLDHPNIVPVFEVGEHQGQQYFSMGFVEGQCLAARLASGPLAPREAVKLMEQVAGAVHYAHERGVIHRDLKPANVLLDRDGRPKVTDFGLAKLTSREQSLTDTGQALGTPGYMPPEQVDGKPVGPQADVYGLGAILYALLTGRPPFQAATLMDTLQQVMTIEPAPPRLLNPAISLDLETIILTCLSKEPPRRYSSAEALASDLRAYLEDRPIAARRPHVAELAFRWVKKQRRSAIIAVIGAVAAVVLLSLGIVAWQDYQKSFNGFLELTTGTYDRMGTEVLRAEVLDEAGIPVGTSFTVPNEEPIALREGAYQLRLSAAGRTSETYGFHLHARSTIKTPVELSRRIFEVASDQLPRDWNDWRARLPLNDGPFVTGRVHVEEPLKTPQDALQSVLEKLAFVPITEPRLVSTKIQADPAEPQTPPPAAVLLLRGEANDYVTMLLVSLASGETLWEKPLAAFWPRQMEGFAMSEPEWPVVEDLDGDGIAEVIVPELDPVVTETTLGVAVHELATGERRWGRALRHTVANRYGLLFSAPRFEFVTENPRQHPPQLRLIAGPDIDRDGHKDIFAVYRVSRHEHRHSVPTLLFVEALSGGDGRTLWRWLRAFPRDALADLDAPLWGAVGIDGWPQLVVSVSGGRIPEFLRGQGGTLLLSAGSGKLQATIPGVHDVLVFDADYNGVADVGKEVTDQSGEVAGTGALVNSGSPLERWRRFGDCHAGDDYDGDGMNDCLAMSAPDFSGNGRPYAAISTRDGRTLWRFDPSLAKLVNPRFVPLHDDVNADGVPDLLTIINGRDDGPVIAISGRDGEKLWESSHLRPSNASETWMADRAHEFVDVDGDGRREIVLTFSIRTDLGWNESTNMPDVVSQNWFVVLSTRDGSIVWKTSLAEEMADVRSSPAWTGDLDGDSLPDFILWSVAKPKMHQGTRTDADSSALVALGGRDGRTLWKWPLPAGATIPLVDNDTVLSETRPEAADLNTDGVPDVLLAYRPAADQRAAGVSQRFELLALDGRDGKTLWDWKIASDSYYRGPSAPKILRLQDRPHVLVTMQAKFDDFRRNVAALLDSNGRLLQPTDLDDPAHAALYFKEDSVMQLWSVNLDGEGDDEVLVQYPTELVALRGGVELNKPEQVLWRFPLSKDVVLAAYPERIEDPAQIESFRQQSLRQFPDDAKHQAAAEADWRRTLGVMRAERIRQLDSLLGTQHVQYGYRIEILSGVQPRAPVTVAVTRFDGLIGLNGANGQPLWCCDGSDAPPVAILGPGDRSPPPAVLYRRDSNIRYSGVICRQSLPAALSDGRIMLKPLALPHVKETALSESKPIITRNLPWVTDWHNGQSRWGLYVWLAGSSATLTGLALIPLAAGIWMVPRAIRTRSRKSALLMLGCFGLAAILMVIKLNDMALLVTVKWVLPIALPLAAFLGRLGRAVCRQQWPLVGWQLLLAAALSLLVAPLWYWYDSRRLESWEQYSWDEWYLIGLLGIWLTGLAIVLTMLTLALRRWTREWRERRQAAAARA